MTAITAADLGLDERGEELRSRLDALNRNLSELRSLLDETQEVDRTRAHLVRRRA